MSNTEKEVGEVLECIKKGENFLLSGGAGSGKTYSLVQVIQQVIKEYPNKKIACMTYTNSAVREIEERVNHNNLQVTTIHDFLWDNIKGFQKALVKCINEERIKFKDNLPIKENFFDSVEEGIQYKEWVDIKKGCISHDEVIILSEHLFKSYPKLCRILVDKFPFIFIDEYQDTQKEIIDIFLNHLPKDCPKQNIIGFFGDSMQSIYDNGIGDLNEYKEKFIEIKKKQNRRNPELIIKLANKLRTDGLEQEASEDEYAPNMKNGKLKKGYIKFIHSSNQEENNLNKVHKYLKWNFFKDVTNTKELNLTHNLIAGKANISELIEIYNSDEILAYKNKVKKEIKENNYEIDKETTFGKVVDKTNIRPRPGKMKDFIDEHKELFEFAKKQPWEEFSKIYVDKDQLLDDKKQNPDEESKKGSQRDNLIKHLFRIQDNIELYKSKKYNEFIRKTNYKISSIKDKKKLQENIDEFINIGEKTIKDVIEKADKYGIRKKDDRLKEFIEKKAYLWERVKKVKFSEFQNLYKYLEGQTPFSTQHKTKGSEFDNVLVILDNGKWFQYNFQDIFEGGRADRKKVLERTQKLFYVCCTRAKENLAVYFHNPNQAIIDKAKEWFGKDNIVNLDNPQDEK